MPVNDTGVTRPKNGGDVQLTDMTLLSRTEDGTIPPLTPSGWGMVGHLKSAVHGMTGNVAQMTGCDWQPSLWHERLGLSPWSLEPERPASHDFVPDICVSIFIYQ